MYFIIQINHSKNEVTYIISSNWAETQSLIQAINIEQLAEVNYFFTVLSGETLPASTRR